MSDQQLEDARRQLGELLAENVAVDTDELLEQLVEQARRHERGASRLDTLTRHLQTPVLGSRLADHIQDRLTDRELPEVVAHEMFEKLEGADDSYGGTKTVSEAVGDADLSTHGGMAISALVALGVNALPVIGVVHGGWAIEHVVWFYVVEILLAVVFNYPKIWFSGSETKTKTTLNVNGQEQEITPKWRAYLLGVFTLFVGLAGTAGGLMLDSAGLSVQRPPDATLALGLLVGQHLVVIAQGNHRRTSPPRQMVGPIATMFWMIFGMMLIGTFVAMFSVSQALGAALTLCGAKVIHDIVAAFIGAYAEP